MQPLHIFMVICCLTLSEQITVLLRSTRHDSVEVMLGIKYIITTLNVLELKI